MRVDVPEYGRRRVPGSLHDIHIRDTDAVQVADAEMPERVKPEMRETVLFQDIRKFPRNLIRSEVCDGSIPFDRIRHKIRKLDVSVGRVGLWRLHNPLAIRILSEVVVDVTYSVFDVIHRKSTNFSTTERAERCQHDGDLQLRSFDDLQELPHGSLIRYVDLRAFLLRKSWGPDIDPGFDKDRRHETVVIPDGFRLQTLPHEEIHDHLQVCS